MLNSKERKFIHCLLISFRYSLQQEAKLGKIISFSFPPVLSCVQDCNYCYAKKAFRLYPTVKKAWVNNFNFVMKHGIFPPLPNVKNKVVRFLVSGDFNVRTLKAFLALVKNHPDYTFFGFTKSWKNKHAIKYLRVLNNFDNVYLRLSVDEQSGYNTPKGFILSGIDTNTTKQKLKNFITCQHTINKINCDTCKICFSENRRAENIILPKH